ncbi:hypothetical protein [Anabaena sp. CS-542/02]
MKFKFWQIESLLGYESAGILPEDATISPLAFPDLQILVLEMLPPIQ